MTEKEPWYHGGLKFTCTGCGDCCTGAPGYVWVNKAEIEALAATVKLTVEEFERRHIRVLGRRKSIREYTNGDCVFFDTTSRGCEVYDARPRQCRTWPFWASNVSTPTDWEATAERCRGCNRGRRVSAAAITAQR